MTRRKPTRKSRTIPFTNMTAEELLMAYIVRARDALKDGDVQSARDLLDSAVDSVAFDTEGS